MSLNYCILISLIGIMLLPKNGQSSYQLSRTIPANSGEVYEKTKFGSENKIPEGLQKYLDRKYSALEKKFLEKLETYMNEKLKPIEKKLDALGKILPSDVEAKIDVLSIGIKILGKKIPDLDEDKNCSMNTWANGTPKKNISQIDDIKQKLDEIEKKISNINNKTITKCNYDELDKKINDLEKNISRKLDLCQNTAPRNAPNNEIPKILEGNINVKLPKFINSTIDKWITEFVGDNTDHDDKPLDTTQKNIINDKSLSNFEKTINEKFDALLNMENKILKEIQKSNDYWRCKKQVTHGYDYKPLYTIDNGTLNHVTLNRNDAGNITYFEMHISVKAAKNGLIMLSPVLDPNIGDHVFEIGVGIVDNKKTDLRVQMKVNVGYVSTPDILSSTHYVDFYIKITDGKLEFGKEGSSTPLMSYSDKSLQSVKYFGFSSWDNEVTFLYDCPVKHF